MKNLFLVRHAKSSWSNADLSDYQRPLNKRGNRDKITMGNRLNNRNELIELIISSSSQRTIETSYALAKAIDYSTTNIQFEKELYHSSVGTMMQFINGTNNEITNLMLIAHNPGISMLCDYLCGTAIDFPTLGMAKISFETNDWQEIFGDTGTLNWFDYPKKED